MSTIEEIQAVESDVWVVIYITTAIILLALVLTLIMTVRLWYERYKRKRRIK